MSEKTTAARNILVAGIGFGLVGGALNHFLIIPVYGQLAFHLGQVAVFLCILIYGLRAGIMASLIASVIFALTINNFMFVLVLTLEVIIVYWLRRKGIKILVADMLFWLLVGVPISCVFISINFAFTADFTLLVLLKQALNGMLYTLLNTEAVKSNPILSFG